MITSDVIPLTLDIRLIRNHNEMGKSFHSDTKPQMNHNNATERRTTALTEESWSEHILNNIVNLRRTHTLNIDFTQRSVSGRGYRNTNVN